MNIRALIAGIGAVAVVGTGGLVLAGTAASAQSGPHPPKSSTLKFVAVTTKTIGYTKAYTAEASSDYNSAGKLIGFDVLHFTENPSGREVTVDGSIDLEDGVIDSTFTTSTRSLKAAGEVTGGTGAYRHAAGTITVVTTSSTKTTVTITVTKK